MYTKAIVTWSLSALALVGCDEEEAVPEESADPAVGVMELPISLRNTASAPPNAISIEVSPTALRVDRHTVLELTGGRLPAGARSGETLSAVDGAIRSGAARRAAIIELHVSTPWETTASILGSLKAANIHTFAFLVRKPGGVADTGYLVIENYSVRAASADPIELEDPTQRNWDEFVGVWQASYEGCRRPDANQDEHYVDCTYTPTLAAPGGKVEIRLFSRGSALKAEFNRFGAEAIDEAANRPLPAMLEGIAAPAPGGEEVEYTPVEAGAFTWRFDAAVAELSPISAAFRPLCGASACGIVVTGDKETMSMRLVSFIGAAFPDGAPAPQVVVHVPAP
jgi:hypothetical protein